MTDPITVYLAEKADKHNLLIDLYEAWRSCIGRHLIVEYEALIEGKWESYDFEGWLAAVALGTGEVLVTLDSELQFCVFDAEREVRNVKVIDTTDATYPTLKPSWETHPDRWEQVAGNWTRRDIEPKAELAECYKCPLAEMPVVLDLNRANPCDVVFIAETPGREEVRLGEFLIGRSGQLLRSVLDQTGLSGKFKVTLNNACLCAAEGAPPVEALACCRARLMSELQHAHPRLVVPAGGVALKTLTGLEGITDVQGLLFDYKLVRRNIKMLPCFHPAALLRRPDLFPDFVGAISKAKMFLEGGKLIDVQPESFKTRVATRATAGAYLKQLLRYKGLSIDLETSGYIPYTDYILCASIAGSNNGKAEVGYTFPWELFDDDRLFEVLIELIESRHVKYYNGSFDCQFLRQSGINAKIGEDPILKHYTLDERLIGQGLKVVARKYCNAPDWEEPLRQYLPSRSTPFTAIPPKVLHKYAALDACYTETLDHLLTGLMDDDAKWVYNNILLPAANMLLDVTSVGIKVDTSKLEELRHDYHQRIDKLVQQLEEMSGVKGFNPRSVKDCRYLLYDKIGLAGDGSTGRKVLDMYPNIPEVVLLKEFRETQKILGTYIEGILDDIVDGRIHPNLRLTGTVTGRLSSRDPNMLGIPVEKGGIKKLFVADEGKLLLVADQKTFELRIIGALSNDRNMMKDFSGGRDFHGEARDRMFHKGINKSSYTHQEVLDAKTVVFGPPYGRGAESVSLQLHCSVREAQAYMDAIWDPYSGAMQFMRDRVKEVHETGEVRSYYGRKRRWGLITLDNVKEVEHEARNFDIQSTATDTNLLIMIGIYNRFDRDLVLPLLPTHDSILMSIDEGKADVLIPQIKEFCSRRAQELLRTDMPFEVDMSVGKCWS